MLAGTENRDAAACMHGFGAETRPYQTRPACLDDELNQLVSSSCGADELIN
jgi:hypothetical protein